MENEWHDLRVNPNDLPQIGQVVLIEQKCKDNANHYHYETSKFCGPDKYKDEPYFDWHHNGFPYPIRWKEIK